LTGGGFAFSELLFDGGFASFVLHAKGDFWGRVRLRVPGRHHVCNALAVAATADFCGISRDHILQGLSSFCGAGRRMEYRGMLCGARVFDDYAHHPTEVKATLGAARQMLLGKGRLFCVFQSHTYSRTAAFFLELCEALRLCDRVLVTDIYAARETDTLGMSGEVLAEGIGERATYVGSLDEAVTVLSGELCAGDLLLVMGAGDIDRIFAQFLRKDFTL
jgi:UDP-N-acetylmuramate--alanine ligase